MATASIDKPGTSAAVRLMENTLGMVVANRSLILPKPPP
jgi:hypothetical protein